MLLPISILAFAMAHQAHAGNWDRVWEQLQKATPAELVPALAHQDGPPVADRDRVLFRFRAPESTRRVYLAGSFNGWANNSGGHVSDARFAMKPSGGGIWFARISVSAQAHQYKYVVEDANGEQKWVPDPFVADRTSDGNSVFDFSRLVLQTPLIGADVHWPRTLTAYKPLPVSGVPDLSLKLQKVWVRPGEVNPLSVHVPEGGSLEVKLLDPFGVVCWQTKSTAAGDQTLSVKAPSEEGGYLIRAEAKKDGRVVAKGEAVLSVVANIADDLRYGFYATYRDHAGDYAAKADMFARLHVNAVEYYDYFPAHGAYAPRETSYKFEPFGVPIDGRDIQKKIESGHARNILSLAYVASYAASGSVYRQCPDPMTDSRGVPKIFNGAIMPEDEADRDKKPKWFWIMDIAKGSAWHKHIMGDFTKALDDSPDDLVSFDGFELDTYGDDANTRFYAKGSPRNGDLLRDVLRDFVGEVRDLTHHIKPHGLVSFNSVNEFAIDNMLDVTDFLFLEIWRGHADSLESLADICRAHRQARRARVVLKVYPADMDPEQKTWPVSSLRRILGATMTGAGSLMAVGEPDEKAGTMHALRSLYYPDHQALSEDQEKAIGDYYRMDALLYGLTHGRGVYNAEIPVEAKNCFARSYAVPAKHVVVVQLLRAGKEKRWSVPVFDSAPEHGLAVVLDLPAGTAPKQVFFASPDVADFRVPVSLDFQVVGSKLQTILPELDVHGTVILRY